MSTKPDQGVIAAYADMHVQRGVWQPQWGISLFEKLGISFLFGVATTIQHRDSDQSLADRQSFDCL